MKDSYAQSAGKELFMPAFLNDITPFLGENTVNEEGKDLSQFLEEYDPNRYENPSVTADIMVFYSKEKVLSTLSGLKLLMIRRRNHPSIGWWALPGGFVDLREDCDAAAKRELCEETGLTDIALEQLCAWGDYNRDPRTRIVTIAYIALIDQQLAVEGLDDAQDAAWFDVALDLIDQKVNSGRKEEIYQLTLTAQGKKSVSARVKYSYRSNSLLLDEKYEVVSRDHLAFDHPAFIVRGLLHLQKRMEELPKK